MDEFGLIKVLLVTFGIYFGVIWLLAKLSDVESYAPRPTISWKQEDVVASAENIWGETDLYLKGGHKISIGLSYQGYLERYENYGAKEEGSI